MDCDRERPEIASYLFVAFVSHYQSNPVERIELTILPITPSSSYYRNAFRAPFVFSTYRHT